MVTYHPQDKPTLLVPANPTRSKLMVANLSDTTIYVSPDGLDIVTFQERAWPIKLNGFIDICESVTGYKGPIFIMVDLASDLRIWET